MNIRWLQNNTSYMKQKHIQLVLIGPTFTSSFFLWHIFHYMCPFQKTNLPPLPRGSSIRYINTQPNRTGTSVGHSLWFCIFWCSFLVNALPRGSCSLLYASLVIRHEVSQNHCVKAYYAMMGDVLTLKSSSTFKTHWGIFIWWCCFDGSLPLQSDTIQLNRT